MIKERTAKDELNGSQEQEHKASVDIEINKDIEMELKRPPRHVDPTPEGSTSRRLWSRNVVEPMGVLVAQPLCSEGQVSLITSSAASILRSS